MGSFGDLIYDLSAALGGGLGKGMQEQHEEELAFGREERGFKRLAPIRKAKRAEDIAAKYGAGAVGAVEEQGEEPYKAGLAEEKARVGRRRTAEELGPALRRLTVPGPQVPESVSEHLREAPATVPYPVPEELTEFGAGQLMDLLEKQQPKPPREPIGGINPFATAYRDAIKRGLSEADAIKAGNEAQADASGMGAAARLRAKAEAEAVGLEDAMQTVETIDRYAGRLITATSPAKATLQGAQLSAGAALGWHPEAAAYQRSIGAWLETVGRQLGGARGVMTEGDISRLRDAIPGFWSLAETRKLQIGMLRNAMEAAISAKQAVAEGKMDLATARARVKKRVDDLFRDRDEQLSKGLPAGWQRQ